MITHRLLAAASLAISLGLAACAGGPVPPAWQADAHSALNTFSSAYLTGNTRLAESSFLRARSELAHTGRFDLVARAELVRCALQVASLDFDECPGFVALAGDADAAGQAYADFLAGRAVNPALLPAHYRAVLEGRKDGLAAIENPQARLIAAGVVLRRGQLAPVDIKLAVETASAQGWRRPLLAWLGVQAKHADSQGDHMAAGQARRRSELLTDNR
jgi:hypothetical protein